MSSLPGITRFALAIALLTCSLPWVAASRAQALEPGAATDNSLELLMDQAPLDQVVKAIAQRTGNHYVFESPLPGRVTLAIPSRVSAAEATEILNAALLLKGMLAIPIEPGKYKIERWERMAGSAPYTEASLSKGAEGAVTTRLVLRHADPELVASTLRPMLQASAHVIPYPPANSLIFAGTENRIHRLMELARLLDSSQSDSLVVVRLRYRDAREVKRQLDGLLSSGGRKGGQGSTADVQIDERTNALLLTASKTQLAQLREWIGRIDIPAASTGELHVVNLIYRDPEELSQLLRGLSEEGTRAADNASAVANVGTLIGRDYSVVAYAATRSLVIRSDRETFDMLRGLIAELDREPRMVRVDIKIFEIATEGNLALGIGAAIPFIDPAPNKVSGALINPAILPLEIPGVVSVLGEFGAPLVQISGADSIPGLGITVIARESGAETKLLQEPSIILEVGEESELFIGDNIPIPVAASNPANVGLAPTLHTTIERHDVGILIRVKATLNSDDSLRLHLHIENKLVRSLGEPGVGPILATRTLDTSFTAGFGQRMIIAGLDSEVRGTEGLGVPFLSKIPILGQATSATRDSHRKIYLLISVQAHLLPTSEEKQATAIALARAVERFDQRLEPELGEKYAVRAASYYKLATAMAAEELLLPDIDPWPTLIAEQESDEGVRFHLFVHGLKTLAEVAEVALALEQAGMTPEIVPLSRNIAAGR